MSNNFYCQQKRKSVTMVIIFVATLFITLGLAACSADVGENNLLTDLGYTKGLFQEIANNKTTFTADEKSIEQIVTALPVPGYRQYSSFTMQSKPVKEIQIRYEINDHYTRDGNGLDPFPGVVQENNALLLLAAVEGLERVTMLHYDGCELNQTTEYTWDVLKTRFGEIQLPGADFADLYQALGSNIQLSEFYFGHYARIYLGVEAERVSYRNGEPHEIKHQPDGSIIWIYHDYGQIYSISPDGPKNDPDSKAFYYFNHAAAAQNDGLTGLYATRFIHGDHEGKTYEEMIKILGLPTVNEVMEDNRRFMAYTLAEGQKRNAYFILHGNKVEEEGVMYGTDASILQLAQ